MVLRKEAGQNTAESIIGHLHEAASPCSVRSGLLPLGLVNLVRLSQARRFAHESVACKQSQGPGICTEAKSSYIRTVTHCQQIDKQ